jgi:hypothetical protein
VERMDKIPMPHAKPSSIPKDFHRKKGTKEQRTKTGALRTIAKPNDNGIRP